MTPGSLFALLLMAVVLVYLFISGTIKVALTDAPESLEFFPGNRIWLTYEYIAGASPMEVLAADREKGYIIGQPDNLASYLHLSVAAGNKRFIYRA